ncbi:MAG: LysM peptidoglycan-binding domain-containing protein, partial [Chloroflexi bacterium]|nr:LysM peptidoglycan-binding domain-containing protein [Chloroflexota bacterium]
MLWTHSAPPRRVAPLLPPSEVSAAEPTALARDPDPVLSVVVAPTPTLGSQVAKPIRYTVKPGDTLRAIAERFGISVQTLIWSNQLENPDLLRPDQELLILPTSGLLHTVQPGETLRQVAARYNVSVADLVRYNDLEDPDALAQGARLVVPGGRPPAVESARAPARPEQATAPELVALGEFSPLAPGGAGEQTVALVVQVVAATPTLAPTPTP